MKIRHATRKDDDAIIEMLRKFADVQPFGRLQTEAKHYHDHHVRKVLSAIRSSGLCLLAEVEGEIAGCFMALIVPDIWLPQIKIMNEVVWWVNPNHRYTTAGARLLTEYKKIGEKYVNEGKISNFTMTLLENSPELDLEKRGFTKIESNYMYEVV